MKASLSSDRQKAWERFKSSQSWRANAPLPLMTRLHQVSKLVRQRFEDELNLSTAQMRILFEAQAPDGVSQATLSKQYELEPAAVTRTAQAMERDGLITRQSDPDDNRFMRVFITNKGRQLIEVMPAQVAQFERELLDGWTDEEVLELHRMLERLEAHFEKK